MNRFLVCSNVIRSTAFHTAGRTGDCKVHIKQQDRPLNRRVEQPCEVESRHGYSNSGHLIDQRPRYVHRARRQ